MKEIPEFNTFEDIVKWVEEERAIRKTLDGTEKSKTEWIPVERKSHIDYFDLAPKDFVNKL